MFRILVFTLLCSIPSVLTAGQFIVSGRVSDSASREPLAFVNIVINDGKQGTVSDIDGRFSLNSSGPVHTLTFSYVGYKPLIYRISEQTQNLEIQMSRISTELSEVLVVAGENPANRIIRNVIKNKPLNNPYNLKSYSYTSYDKMIFTVNVDSLHPSATAEPDSVKIKLRQLLQKQHLFMMESVSEHQYLYPGRDQDKIIATRVSGFKDPLFVFLISRMQSASFYDDVIDFAGTNYLNPISEEPGNRYFFSLRDTIYSDIPGDSTFVISFRPKPGKNFDGMKGLLYISNNRWAIRNVIASPDRENQAMDMRIQQMYEFLDNRQWFPVQLNTEIVFNKAGLGGSNPVGIGKSYRRDVKLDAAVSGHDLKNIAVEVMPDASLRDEQLWNRYRTDSLTRREINTYRVLDSLGKANHFDNRIKGLSALVSGKIPLGYLDFDLNRLMRYSTYEGFFLGAGLHTSERLSRFITIGGYTGYGFRDKDVKYGTDLLLKLQQYGNVTFGVKYSYDLEETGGTSFFDDDISVFTPENYRRFYVTRMDRTENAQAMLGFRVLRYVRAGIGIARSHKKAAYDYFYQQTTLDPAVLTDEYVFGKIIAGIKFAWGETFIRNTRQQLSLGTKFPVLWFQFTGNRKGFLNGQYRFNRFDARIRFTFNTLLVGKTHVQLSGGLVDRPAPYSELFDGYGSRASGLSVFSPGSFATMRTDEFINDRYAAVFIMHNFGTLLFRSRFFEPELGFAINAGVGSLSEASRHRNATFRTMEKGYYEGGVLINSLLKSAVSGIGIGLFYRAGPYSFDKFSKNLSLKLTLSTKI